VLLAGIDPGRGCEPGTQAALWQINKLFDLRLDGRNFASEQDASRGTLLFQCLEYLLLQLDRRGGAATLAFVPSTEIPSAKAILDMPWAFDGSLEIGRLISARLKLSGRRSASEAPQDMVFQLKADDALSKRLNDRR